MTQDNSRLLQFVAALLRGASGIRLGPGVLATIIPISFVGFISVVGVVWALNARPELAIAGVVLVLGFVAYVTERAFRYAETNPIPALLGGSELLQLMRDQMSAKERAIVSNDDTVVGASTKSIEPNGGSDA